MNAKTVGSTAGDHRGADDASMGRGSTAAVPLFVSGRAFPDLSPRRIDVSFCQTIDHCRSYSRTHRLAGVNVSVNLT